MAKQKVRCVECGAKNTDELAERCRICGGLLPDAVRRRVDRLNEVGGPTFNLLVEQEVEAWKELERRTEDGPRSRRPTEDDSDQPRRWGRRSR